MNYEFIRKYVTKKLVIIVLVVSAVIALLFTVFTTGTMTLSPPEGYTATIQRFNQFPTKIEPYDAGFHFMRSGDYVVTISKDNDIYTKKISIKPFFQHTEVSITQTESRLADQLIANSRQYLLPYGDRFVSYDKFSLGILQHTSGDPFGFNNSTEQVVEQDGFCRVFGHIGNSPYCVAIKADYDDPPTIHAINPETGYFNEEPKIELRSDRSAARTDNNALVVATDKSIDVYSDITDDASTYESPDTVAVNGFEPIATVRDRNVAWLSGSNFDDMVGDSESQADLEGTYKLHVANLTSANVTTIDIGTLPRISTIHINPSGEYIAANTLDGVYILSADSGEVVFTVQTVAVKDMLWQSDTQLIYQTVDGIFSIDLGQFQSSPIFNHPNLTISSLQAYEDKIFFTGFYKNQTDQQPYGFVLHSSADDSTYGTNDIFDHFPHQTPSYQLMLDQTGAFILPIMMQGSGGFADTSEGSPEQEARAYLQEHLPATAQNVPINVISF